MRRLVAGEELAMEDRLLIAAEVLAGPERLSVAQSLGEAKANKAAMLRIAEMTAAFNAAVQAAVRESAHWRLERDKLWGQLTKKGTSDD
jgi:hypothetical protein